MYACMDWTDECRDVKNGDAGTFGFGLCMRIFVLWDLKKHALYVFPCHSNHARESVLQSSLSGLLLQAEVLLPD